MALKMQNQYIYIYIYIYTYRYRYIYIYIDIFKYVIDKSIYVVYSFLFMSREKQKSGLHLQ